MAGAKRSVEWWSQRHGELVARLRSERGWTRQQLADQLGAAPSWVSQLESGGMKPSPTRLAALGMLLGPEVARAEPEAEDDERYSAETIGLPCLWRARADLLARLPEPGSSREQRLRLHRLSRDLLAAAAAQPAARPFVQGNNLLSLPELAAVAPESVRWAVAVEVGGMKIDAPYETDFGKRHRLASLDNVVADLDLPFEQSADLQDALSKFPRERPHWQDLRPVGGAVGVLQASLGSDSHDLRLLAGDDPAGWLGFDFVAGTWLVRWATRHDATDRIHGKAADAPASWWDGLDSATTPGGAGPAAMIPAAFALGGPIGLAIGVAAAGALAGRAAAKRSADRAATEASAAEDDTAPAALPGAKLTATIAEALGRHWVRVESAKLCALYRVSRTRASEVPDGLPDADAARGHLQATCDVVRERYRAEAAASGTESHDRNERLRELADIGDSLKAAMKFLPQT